MTKHSPFLQRHIIFTTLKTLICFTLLRASSSRNYFSDLDLSSQTLIPTVTGFKMTGNAASDRFGVSVNTAGDINNDGYDDIIIGAYAKNSYQGAAYVIYGGEESSFFNIDLSTTTLNPSTTGFKITGSAVGDSLGRSVSTAGDINKDGYADIIIGAENKNAAYVIYGGPKSAMSNWDFSSGATLNPSTTGFMITGNAAGDQFGYSVSTAGDMNNDGYDDIIIAAPQKNSAQGVAYVIYGGEKSAMSNILLSSTTLNPTSNGFMITGNAVGDKFAQSVNKAGDIDNDGYDDIIVGTRFKDSNRGAAYVIYGREKSSMSNIDLSTQTLNPSMTGFMITGNAATDAFGIAVNTAGDINNDGYDDIIIGAYGKNSFQGAAYVVYGGTKLTRSNIVLSSTTLSPTSTGFTITGGAAFDNLGISVSTAGDINKDGYADIIIGAYAKNAAYVIYGGPKSAMSNWDFSSGVTLNPLTTGFMITGNAAGDYFAQSVRMAGDINNDGYDDIIIGAYNKNGQQGAAYLIYASCSANCKQCSSEPVCTECKNPFLLAQSKCFASCPESTVQTSPTICSDCPAYCKKCSSTTVCTECQNSYILYQDKCLDVCPDGMFLSTPTGTCEDCQTPCSKCTSLTACTECINPLILYTSGCLPSCPKAMYISNNVCKDCPSYCSYCTSQDSCQVCFKGYTLSNSNSLCVLSGAQEKASQVIASATQGIGSIVSVGSSVFPFSALVSKIVQNTRYLNLSVTGELAEVYETWRTDLISWEVPNVMSDLDHFETSPVLFAQYDIDSPFLVNFWPTLINIGIGFGAFTAFVLLRKVFEHEKYEGWAYPLVLKLVAGSFNFALIQAYACLDDILFYLVIDAKTNPFNSFFSWASMICAVLFLAFGCLQVFFNVWTVYKYQSIKNQGVQSLEAFNERNKYWELFYSDFNDDDLWSQAFFAIAIIRSVLSSFMITVFYDYPLLQTSYLIMMDAAIILFLYFKSPFNTLRGKLAQYYYEIITLLVHLCAFILALQDSFDKSSETVRKIMSTGILYLNTALISGAIGFMFIEIYKTISEKERAARLKKRQSVPEDSQETQNLTQTVDRLQSSEITAQKRQDWINREHTVSIEDFHLESENQRKRNFVTSDFNRESDSHNDNSLQEMKRRERIHPQRNQTPAPIMVRQRPQAISQHDNPINPNFHSFFNPNQ